MLVGALLAYARHYRPAQYRALRDHRAYGWAGGGLLAPHLPLRWPAGALGRGLLFTAASLLVASCSWLWFERPINRLKQHFPYSAARAMP